MRTKDIVIGEVYAVSTGQTMSEVANPHRARVVGVQRERKAWSGDGRWGRWHTVKDGVAVTWLDRDEMGLHDPGVVPPIQVVRLWSEQEVINEERDAQEKVQREAGEELSGRIKAAIGVLNGVGVECSRGYRRKVDTIENLELSVEALERLAAMIVAFVPEDDIDELIELRAGT